MQGDLPDKPRRGIRSFVLRAGRLTTGQQRALDELYPEFGVDDGDAALDLATLFGRDAPTVIEIGFGNGDATWRMAEAEPEKNFLAIEVHPPGVGRLLQEVQARDIGNIRVAMTDAVALLQDRVADGSLAGVRIYFPDPWHKKRHHKRRIIQPGFTALLARKLAPGGILHLATDWVPYSEHMLEVLDAEPLLENRNPDGGFSPQPEWRPNTKYERRGDRLGHETRDLVFRRTDT
ncbi:tRNA (guanosine(46)-N7)-methyltransferase TrmB [Marinihelvus fidelis]|uniref:tRNA (guanine-N(7)-)-methyltransferase n=1 Tax=Marinihelvus fidelis TaxID=2613842 RepID=A0A5N0T7J2_9GAMM|nr:tRNA (guanosine(46)-N7)-methyltransferase TrmB [Marinihelvus fidelis]KAA9130953.1 tRNA (guanosine(46)-N7)-methyltransferase TrmB [Marinihelvus fidelis]